MFSTNAAVYYHNAYFRAKMAMLACAGINIVIFERTAGRSMHRWDRDAAAPRAGRTAAVVSLVVWIGIIFLGRWVGFTTTHTNLKPDTDFNIDELFAPGGNEPRSHHHAEVGAGRRDLRRVVSAFRFARAGEVRRSVMRRRDAGHCIRRRRTQRGCSWAFWTIFAIRRRGSTRGASTVSLFAAPGTNTVLPAIIAS